MVTAVQKNVDRCGGDADDKRQPSVAPYKRDKSCNSSILNERLLLRIIKTLCSTMPCAYLDVDPFDRTLLACMLPTRPSAFTVDETSCS